MTMNNTPRIPDAIDAKRLASMRQVARMKELADRTGKMFIGGFTDDAGQMFIMTNIEDPVTRVRPTDEQLLHFLQGFQDGMNNLGGAR